ncbi:MAG: hypothetical protein VB125_01845 [Burkholderia sp.]
MPKIEDMGITSPSRSFMQQRPLEQADLFAIPLIRRVYSGFPERWAQLCPASARHTAAEAAGPKSRCLNGREALTQTVSP